MKVVAILGPTGVGKSRVAFQLAQALGGEIVVCDSRQVYASLDIATNKPSATDLETVPYHLVGIADPRDTFNVFQFVRAASDAIADIGRRGRLPIVEGGSMLWADALIEGYSLGGVPPRKERRTELESLPLEELRALLHDLDPEARVDDRNRVRLTRAIEVLEAAGPPLSRLRNRTPPPWTSVRVGLRADPSVIDSRLEARSRQQVERGLIEETRAALAAGVLATTPVMTGIGYAEALAYLRGELTFQELPQVMARANRRYARRQLRWLTRDSRITWFDAADDPVPSILEFLRERLT